MAKEAQPLLYATQAEVEDILGAVGVRLRVDDGDDGTIDPEDADRLQEAIWEATDIINEYALHYYTAEALETSAWIRRKCSYMAAYLMGRRRGNKSIYKDEYDQTISRLQRIQNGLLNIPRLPKRDDFEPRMSNLVVDQNYSKKKIRADRSTSVGPDDPQQHADYLGERRFI